MGTIIEGEPPIYVGIYVDDIIYFSSSDNVERQFENLLSTIGSVDFMGQVSHFLGIEFTWQHHDDGHLTISLTQQLFAEDLIESLGFSSASISTFLTPYRSGRSIDSILHEEMSPTDRDALRLNYQSLVGSLNWLAHTTQLDLSTVVSLLAQHQSNPSLGHLEAARYATKYLAKTKTLGLYFTSRKRSILESFLHFPIPDQVMSMADANWGPQDALQCKLSMDLPLFTSRSMSAFYIDLLGPLPWISKPRKSLQVALLKPKFTLRMNVSSFFWNLFKLWNFLM
jgi:hypothetical protein